MKNRIWISVGMLGLAALVGCGSKEKEQAANGSAPVANTQQDVTQTPTTTPVAVAATTPEEAVSSFLNALQTGDKQVAAAMLTTKARQETEAHDMVVEPPGAPNATYKVGRVQHPGDLPDAAYVSCLWSEKYKDGEEESYEVVWVLRRETAGWRVAGMATQLDGSEEPVFLDFEDLTAMEDAVQKAEATQTPPSETTAAQNPAAAPTVR